MEINILTIFVILRRLRRFYPALDLKNANIFKHFPCGMESPDLASHAQLRGVWCIHPQCLLPFIQTVKNPLMYFVNFCIYFALSRKRSLISSSYGIAFCTLFRDLVIIVILVWRNEFPAWLGKWVQSHAKTEMEVMQHRQFCLQCLIKRLCLDHVVGF